MTLRTRLLLGYGYLVALVLLSAGGAALAFHQLGRSIDRLLRENFRSMQAAMRMIDSLERQDSATLALLLGDAGAGAALRAAEEAFTASLEQASENVTEAAEAPLIEGIRTGYASYADARSALLASLPEERPLVAYERSVFPAFAVVKQRVFGLLEVNHQAMVEADREARRFAVRASIGLGVLVALALLSLGFLSRQLQVGLLGRLAEMREAAERIAAGERRRRVRATGDDELAVVGRQLNAALDAYVDQESRAGARLNQQRLLLLGMLDRWPEPAAVVGLDGVLVASTLDPDRTTLVVVAEEAINSRGRSNLSRADSPRDLDFSLSIGEAEIQVCALVADGTRPAGWLVRVRVAHGDESRQSPVDG